MERGFILSDFEWFGSDRSILSYFVPSQSLLKDLILPPYDNTSNWLKMLLNQFFGILGVSLGPKEDFTHIMLFKILSLNPPKKHPKFQLK